MNFLKLVSLRLTQLSVSESSSMGQSRCRACLVRIRLVWIVRLNQPAYLSLGARLARSSIRPTRSIRIIWHGPSESSGGLSLSRSSGLLGPSRSSCLPSPYRSWGTTHLSSPTDASQPIWVFGPTCRVCVFGPAWPVQVFEFAWIVCVIRPARLVWFYEPAWLLESSSPLVSFKSSGPYGPFGSSGPFGSFRSSGPTYLFGSSGWLGLFSSSGLSNPFG